MSQGKKPLITDLSSLIRGATEKPAPIVLGDKSSTIEQPAATPVTTKKTSARAAVKIATKPKPAAEQGRAPAKEAYPWDDANPKIKMYVQLRAPEALVRKYDYILAHTLGVSGRHELLLDALENAADKMIQEIKKYGHRGG